MNFTTRAKALVGAVAIGGATIAMGGAFTAGGITQGAPTAQFIGGTARQTVSGATLSQINYTPSTDLTTISAVKVVLGTDGADKNVNITFNEGGTLNTGYTCQEEVVNANRTGTYNCTTTGTQAANATTTSLDVRVTSKTNVTY